MFAEATEVKQANAGPPRHQGETSMKHGTSTEAPQGILTHRVDGKVVSVTGDKLLVKKHDGQACSHSLAKDARLTRDGVACKAADLNAGTRIRVTTRKYDRDTATCIEAIVKDTEFCKCD